MEGPPVRIVADKLAPFEGTKVTAVAGNSRIEKQQAQGLPIVAILSRGKNLFVRFSKFAFRIHFLMYGSYRINEDRDGITPRLSLSCTTGVMNFYNCAVNIIEAEEIDTRYLPELDITGQRWSSDRTMRLVTEQDQRYICDVLLDQDIFMGVGNIIKNEALFMAGVHPLSLVDNMPAHVLSKTTSAAREFSCLFYDALTREERLNPYLNIYRKRYCAAFKHKTTMQRTGDTRRISSFCPVCQILYA